MAKENRSRRGCFSFLVILVIGAFLGIAGTGFWMKVQSDRQHEIVTGEIEQVMKAQAEAWSRGDIQAVCSFYTDQSIFVTPKGLVRGRKEIEARYRKSYPDAAAMGKLVFQIQDLQATRGREVTLPLFALPGKVHIVTVAAKWTLTVAGQEPKSGWTLLVFHKIGHDWKVIQDASM